jgi:uncharacterized protein with PQ loop repeat
MLIVETCGLASSVLITVMFVPQVVHTCRTKDTDGLSYAFLVTNLVASGLGLVYSAHFHILPMMIANVSASLFSFCILWTKSECSSSCARLDSV